MGYRLIDVRSNIKNKKMLDVITAKKNVLSNWSILNSKDEIRYSILVKEENVQEITDAITTTLGYTNTIRLIVTSVEATIPKIKEDSFVNIRKKKRKFELSNKVVSVTPKLSRISREELYSNIEKGAILNKNFLMFVFFSIIVCAIGMIEDNTTIVIGSMVIAPLLDPIMAFAFAITIGDEELMSKATRTTLAGLFFVFCNKYLRWIYMGICFWRSCL